MQAPVLTPLNRASVSTATCLPHGRYRSADVTWYVSSIPLPSGPRHRSTRMSHATTRFGPSPLIAAIASFSVVNTLTGPTFQKTPSGSTTDGSMAVDLMTDPAGQRFPRGNVTVLVRPRDR